MQKPQIQLKTDNDGTLRARVFVGSDRGREFRINSFKEYDETVERESKEYFEDLVFRRSLNHYEGPFDRIFYRLHAKAGDPFFAIESEGVVILDGLTFEQAASYTNDTVFIKPEGYYFPATLAFRRLTNRLNMALAVFLLLLIFWIITFFAA